MVVHTCDQCDYTSLRRANLLRHARGHTGEKPFACEHCDYRCADKSSLRAHLTVHTGERKFKCE
jgi:KRAB domain-containing zinc finger protein